MHESSAVLPIDDSKYSSTPLILQGIWQAVNVQPVGQPSLEEGEELRFAGKLIGASVLVGLSFVISSDPSGKKTMKVSARCENSLYSPRLVEDLKAFFH
mmetsp:Transcript_37084/g.96143  ORF Transcript_37084/g.96143 Transcript_37084/m.96143 type:complete len:99 (+) Transcript_37084:2438-2734(+)